MLAQCLEPVLATRFEFLIANGLSNSIDVGAKSTGSSIAKASCVLLIKYELVVSV